MTYTTEEQNEFRAAFIKEARQKSWGAICNADMLRAILDAGRTEYTKLEERVAALNAEIDASEKAVDYHTVENREKRKALTLDRNTLSNDLMPALTTEMQRMAKQHQQLLANAEMNFRLEAHAKEFSVKEPKVESVDESSEGDPQTKV
jgi:hypothetical protein